MKQQQRHYCRNQRCRTKLSVLTDNEHKAFCSRYCYDQFFQRRCRVCEESVPGRKAVHTRCRSAYNRFRYAYSYADAPSSPFVQVDSKSPCAAGTDSGLNPLWTLPLDPETKRRVDAANFQPHPMLMKRDLADPEYVAVDEARLRSTPTDADGNYPPMIAGVRLS